MSQILLLIFFFLLDINLNPVLLAPASDPNKKSNSEGVPQTSGAVGNGGDTLKAGNKLIINRKEAEKLCPKKARKCWASDKRYPICASNGKVYKNPGVLICAQTCDNSIEFKIFCKSKTNDEYNEKDKTFCVNCPHYEALVGAKDQVAQVGT